MARSHVRPPDALPGEFFLLTYSKDAGSFELRVDDIDCSSYKLGGDVPTVMRYFARMGLSDLGDRAIDIAKEFGAAQAIPGKDGGRVIPIYERPNGRGQLKWPDETDDRKSFNLPSL